MHLNKCNIAVFLACLFGLIYSTQSQQTTSRTRSSLSPKIRTNTSPSNETSAANRVQPVASNPRTRPNQPQSTTTTTTFNKRDQNAKAEFVEDELPADFYEFPPEQLDLGMNVTGRAPAPMLNVAVLQDGKVIDNAVNPGTLLEMVIYLDDKSAKVYGLLASYLKVTDDTFRQREEVIIANGCSIDTHIFGNFELNPEDQSLRAKFKAFKFPDSNFVRFVGTVNVCIKQCNRVNCDGTRRRKRRSSDLQAKDNRLVFTVSTVLKINDLALDAETQRLN